MINKLKSIDSVDKSYFTSVDFKPHRQYTDEECKESQYYNKIFYGRDKSKTTEKGQDKKKNTDPENYISKNTESKWCQESKDVPELKKFDDGKIIRPQVPFGSTASGDQVKPLSATEQLKQKVTNAKITINGTLHHAVPAQLNEISTSYPTQIASCKEITKIVNQIKFADNQEQINNLKQQCNEILDEIELSVQAEINNKEPNLDNANIILGNIIKYTPHNDDTGDKPKTSECIAGVNKIQPVIDDVKNAIKRYRFDAVKKYLIDLTDILPAKVGKLQKIKEKAELMRTIKDDELFEKYQTEIFDELDEIGKTHDQLVAGDTINMDD